MFDLFLADPSYSTTTASSVNGTTETSDAQAASAINAINWDDLINEFVQSIPAVSRPTTTEASVSANGSGDSGAINWDMIFTTQVTHKQCNDLVWPSQLDWNSRPWPTLPTGTTWSTRSWARTRVRPLRRRLVMCRAAMPPPIGRMPWTDWLATGPTIDLSRPQVSTSFRRAFVQHSQIDEPLIDHRCSNARPQASKLSSFLFSFSCNRIIEHNTVLHRKQFAQQADLVQQIFYEIKFKFFSIETAQWNFNFARNSKLIDFARARSIRLLMLYKHTTIQPPTRVASVIQVFKSLWILSASKPNFVFPSQTIRAHWII